MMGMPGVSYIYIHTAVVVVVQVYDVCTEYLFSHEGGAHAWWLFQVLGAVM